jgi:hypothetical protein
MAVAMLALQVSLGGSATAAVHALITTRDIKDGTIRLVDISNGAKTSLHAHTAAARVYSSKDEPNRIQIAGGPVQRLSFDSVSFDTGHLFDARRPTDLTAPVAGVYLITTNVSWAIEPTGPAGINRAVYVYVNNHVIAVDQRPPAGETRQTVTTLYKLSAGDTVDVGIGQDGGDMVANAGGDYAPSLAMALIGPT